VWLLGNLPYAEGKLPDHPSNLNAGAESARTASSPHSHWTFTAS